MIKNRIILLYGPTASGKSKLALDIAKKFNGEIVNADSMQVYKEVKILSARPNDKSVKHHLYGFVSVKENRFVSSLVDSNNSIFLFFFSILETDDPTIPLLPNTKTFKKTPLANNQCLYYKCLNFYSL